jgi:outer membrane biosynthesis protein TonB
MHSPLKSRPLTPASDQSIADLRKGPSAYSEGIVDFQSDFQTQRQSESDVVAQKRTEPFERAEQGEESEAEQIYKGLESMAWLKRKGVTTQAQRERSVFGAPANTRQTVAGTNTSSRALDQGGFQLSTYDWEFAPYMTYVKKRVESNVFLPPAFSSLGMIEGKSVLKFRIQRDGSMERVDVMDSRGSELLLKTVIQAIELSSPWKPLPADFPDPFLEIEYTFTFVIDDRQ